MPLSTRLTKKFGIKHPVISAPMAFAAGGALAAAVTKAGGLGLIGGGYGDAEWLEDQFMAAGNTRVGCGFISWSLAEAPHLLDLVLEREPSAVFLSYGDPTPFAASIRDANVPLMCQVQTLKGARAALDAGAEVIIAQGGEAGGHVEARGTFPLVPEIADLLAKSAPDTLLCAAGGVADGRGLAAALMLGADGVLVGSRFCACEEALVFPGWHEALVKADGDVTVQTSVVDIARSRDWPDQYKIRVLQNALIERWQGREDEMRAHQSQEAARYEAAAAAGDTDNYGVIVGEAVGLIRSIEPAGAALERMVAQGEALLKAAPSYAAAGES